MTNLNVLMRFSHKSPLYLFYTMMQEVAKNSYQGDTALTDKLTAKQGRRRRLRLANIFYRMRNGHRPVHRPHQSFKKQGQQNIHVLTQSSTELSQKSQPVLFCNCKKNGRLRDQDRTSVQVSTPQATSEICMQAYINIKLGTLTHHVHGYNILPAIFTVLSIS